MNNFCPACLQNKTKNRIKVPDFEYGLPYSAEYFECDHCATNFQKPMPSLKKISSYYPKNYHSFKSLGILKVIRSWMRLIGLKKFININDKILDFGCGNGDFLFFASKSFPKCMFYGYEISPKNEIKKYNQERVVIIKGSIDFLMRKIPEVKIISMNHTIEHLIDPERVLKKLKKRIKIGGIIDGQTPASDSFEKSLFKKYWSGFHSPRHTVIFSRSGLKDLTLRAGMRKIIIKPAFNPASYAVSFHSYLFKNKKIARKGLIWFIFIIIGSFFSIFDLILLSSGVINFRIYR